MLDINVILENPQKIKEAAASKGVDLDINIIIDKINQQKRLNREVQKLQEERNKHAKAVGIASPDQRVQLIEQGKKAKEILDEKEKQLNVLNEETLKLIYTIPNPPKPDVKIFKDETGNEVIRKWGEPKKFNFTIKDHLEIGEAFNIIDVKAAAKISGSRFSYLLNDGALLEFGLKQYAFDLLMKEGFTPVIPPVLIHKAIMDDLGYTQMGEAENIFSVDNDNFYLVGTAEQSIVPIFKDEVLRKEDLPKRFVGFSTSFRREAGSYGKDTRGIFRVHQFDKVEMVSFVPEGEDDAEQEYFLSLEEKFFQSLEIPYQVVRMCSGDLGFNAARKYDIDAWIPSMQKYREITSTSTVTDFQSRRLNMRYQDGDIRKYLSVINGTAFSMNRPIIAILENYQQEDGSVIIPEVLRKYIGKEKISSKL